MGNTLVGFPNRSDDGTLSGGGWETSLPLSNLQTRYLAELARSTDATKANTQFENDLSANYPIRGLGLFRHNLSLAALYRIRGRPAETASRGTTAFYQDEDGTLVEETATGDIRHWNYEYDENNALARATLLEAATVNQFTQPEDLTHGDWTAAGLSARNANQAGDPEGGTGLDELVENSSNVRHEVSQAATLTADGNYALSAWYVAGARTVGLLALLETASASNIVECWFDLSTGAVGTNNAGGTASFVRAYIEDWTAVAAGLYRCVLVGSVGNGATGITGRVAMADADGNRAYLGDGSSSLYAGFAMLEDAKDFASSYHDGTRNTDALSDTVPFTPADIVAAGGLTVYSEWIERGTLFTGGSSRLWQVGGATASADPRLYVVANTSGGSTGRPAAIFDDGSAVTQSIAAADTVSLFDHVRARVVIFLDGSDWKIQLHFSVNGGAETSATAGTIGSTLPAAWSANTLTFNAAPDGTAEGYAAHIVHVFAPGVKTLAEMTRLARQ